MDRTVRALFLACVCAVAVSSCATRPVPPPGVAEDEPVLEPGERTSKEAAGPIDIGNLELELRARPHDLLLGSLYRQAIIETGEHDRCVEFLEELTASFPLASDLELNLAYAYIDKIPSEGAIGRLLLANKALGRFTRALEIEDSWLGRYSRGTSYLYWPAFFGRGTLAAEDLQRAIEMASTEPFRPHHALAHVALGDAFWRLGRPDRMREAWLRGYQQYPESEELGRRLELDDDAATVDAFLAEVFDPGRRVATDLALILDDR